MTHQLKKVGNLFGFRKHFLALGLVLATGAAVNAQCSSDAFMDNCSSALEDFNFIKSFEYANPKGGAKAE